MDSALLTMTKLLMISGDRRTAAGVEGAFYETLKELHRHFERIDVLCPRITGDQHVRSLFGNVYFHPASRGLFWQPFFIARMGKKFVKAHGHDVVTIHDYPPFYNGFGARRLLKKTGIPAALELHHLVGWPRAASFSEWIGRVMSRFILPSHCKAFSAVRVVNHITKDILSRWGVDTRNVQIVPSMYLDLDAISHAASTPKTYDLAFAARLVANKGLTAVLDALALLPNVTLLIVGDGPEREAATERIRALGLEDRVTCTGWLPTHADVLRAIASARVFVMNSSSEGGPRSAIEAMALGLPLLTTKVGLMPEVVQDGVHGFFVDGTAQNLAVKAEVLLQDQARINSMSAACKAATGVFEKAAAIRVYADFLKSLPSTTH